MGKRSHGEGSIYKSRGRWVAAVTVEGRTGVPMRRRRIFRTQAEARDGLSRLRKEAAEGRLEHRRLTLAQFLEEWRKQVLPARGIGANTMKNYDWALDSHLIPALGQIRLDRLRAEHVDQLLRDLTERGLAHNSVMRVRSVLKTALDHAERRDMVRHNVARLSVLPPGPRRRSRALTPDQARQLLLAAQGDPLEAAYVLQLTCGLRPGEVLGLTWDDVDLAGRRLHIRHSLVRSGNTYVLGPTKTPRSVRSLSLPAPAVQALRSRRRAHSADRLAAGTSWAGTNLVFTTSVGTHIDQANYRRSFSRVAERAGLGHWQPRELRHSAVSILSAEGVPLEEVADLVGHSGIRMTAEVYRHAVKPTVDAAVAPMERVLGSISI
jgi:integrase